MKDILKISLGIILAIVLLVVGCTVCTAVVSAHDDADTELGYTDLWDVHNRNPHSFKPAVGFNVNHDKSTCHAKGARWYDRGTGSNWQRTVTCPDGYRVID